MAMSDRLNQKYETICRTTVYVGAFTAMGSGALALIGWQLGVPLLASLLPGFAPMHPVSALAFALSGAALWLLHRPEGMQTRRAGQACAAVVGALGLVQGIAMVSRGPAVDKALRAVGTGAMVPQPRMQASVAFGFLLVGLALFLIDVESRRGRRPTQFLVLPPVLGGLMVLMGYLYGVIPAIGTASNPVISVNTALNFILVAAAIFVARPNNGLTQALFAENSGGAMARRVLPAAVAAPILLGWLALLGVRAKLYDGVWTLPVVVATAIVTLASVIWLNAYLLGRADAARRQATEALRDALAESQRTQGERSPLRRSYPTVLIAGTNPSPLPPPQRHVPPPPPPSPPSDPEAGAGPEQQAA
jgi:hypothetical protein